MFAIARKEHDGSHVANRQVPLSEWIVTSAMPRLGHRLCKIKNVVFAASLFALTCNVTAEVVRIDYLPTSNVQQRRSVDDERGFEVAGSSYVAFALAPLVELPSREYDVSGFRFSLLVGEHTDVYGLDIGLLGSMVKREVGGIQLSGLFNVIGESSGVLQVAAAVNNCRGSFAGVQVGAINIVEKGCGVQIGFLNRANSLEGIQIGVLNFIENSSVPFLPLANLSF